MLEVALVVAGAALLSIGILIGQRFSIGRQSLAHHEDLARRTAVLEMAVGNLEQKAEGAHRKIAVLTDHLKDAKMVIADVKRVETLVDTHEKRLAIEEKETATIYTHMQRLEHLLHANTGKEMAEMAKLLEEAGVELPRDREHTIRPAVHEIPITKDRR